MFWPSRTAARVGPDPLLPWRVRAFALGAGLALAGFATERRWLVHAAIAVLAVALGLRFASRWAARSRSPDAEDAGSGGEGTPSA